jgi:short-subunit dehydrogenase
MNGRYRVGALLMIFVVSACFYWYGSFVEKPKLGSKIIIVGGTSGIGAALVRECVKRGYIVGVTGRRIDVLRDMKVELNNAIFIQCMDISFPEKAQEELIQLIHEMGGMDIIVVNSGTMNARLDFQSQNNIVKVNVVGFMAMASAALEYFMKKGSGHIVGISSCVASRGIKTSPAYSASKAFVANYLEGIRARLRSLNVPLYVTDIRPGLVNTAMTQDPTIAKRYFTALCGATPEAAAREICDAIEQRKSCAYVTKSWKILGRLLQILPDCIFHGIFQTDEPLL